MAATEAVFKIQEEEQQRFLYRYEYIYTFYNYYFGISSRGVWGN